MNQAGPLSTKLVEKDSPKGSYPDPVSPSSGALSSVFCRRACAAEVAHEGRNRGDQVDLSEEGSVSTKVVRAARVPVLVCPHGKRNEVRKEVSRDGLQGEA